MPSRISSPVLIGRDRELSAIATEIAAASAGSPRFVVVRGEAGIGKSRLVAEAIAAARAAGTLVLVGECLDIGPAGLPYLPIAGALRELSRSVTPDALHQLLGPGRRDLATIVPELDPGDGPGPWGIAAAADAAGRAGAPGSADLPSALGQARLFERILGLFGALSAAGPTVLVVEDVHWIDRATRDLLTFLSRNLTTERLAIVLTCRADDLPRGHPILAWLAAVERAQPTTVVELTRLDRGAVDQQLRVIGGESPAPELADGIWRRSEGNPLLVEELFAAGGGDAPGSVVEVLLARVARLDPGPRALVEAVAIAGRGADERLLAAVLEVTEAEADDRLRAALEHRVLGLDPTTGRYRFRHELLRETVEAELQPGNRRRLHEQFARRLVERRELADPSPVGAATELAHHFVEAGIESEAYAYAIRAAEAAESVHAYADAHRQWERAFELEARVHPGGLDTATRVEHLRRASNDADLGGELARALELARQALALVDPAADPTAAGMLHSRIGYLQWMHGDGTAAIDAHREGVRLVPADPPTAERARVLASLGGALMGAGRWAESRDVCEAAIACAAAAGAPAEESRARNMLGSDLVALGAVDEGIAELRHARRLAEEGEPTEVLIVADYNLALNLATTDRLEEALAAAEAGREAAQAAGLLRRYGQDLAALHGDILLRLGRVDAAQQAVDAGFALASKGSRTVYLATVRARISGIHGDIDDVETRLAPFELHAQDPDIAAYVAAVRAEALAWADRPAEVLAVVQAGIRELEGLDDVLWTAPLVGLGLRAAAELSEAARAHRSGEGIRDAGAAAETLRAHLDRIATRVSTASGRGWVALARGELARLEGETSAAAWQQAIEAFDAVPAPIEAAYARYRAAEAGLRAAGVRADVADLVRGAAAVAEASGSRPLAEAVAILAARARIPSRAAASAETAPADAASEPRPVPEVTEPRAAASALGLSAREIEVLELVAAGMSNGEIAERLFITRKTAAVHVTHILDKLGVPNRVGAAMVAARVGLGSRAPEELGPGGDA